MRIKEVESFVVRAPVAGDQPYWGTGFWADDPMDHPARPSDYPGDITTEYPAVWRFRALYPTGHETVIIRLETDTGLVGWGEAHTPVAPGISVAVVDHLLRDCVYGRNPLDINPIWENMYSTMRLRGHRTGFLLEAISGIDIALHDIAGKSLGVPVAKLLGGKMRERIAVYASSLPRIRYDKYEEGLAGVVEQAGRLVDEGYHAMKVKLGLDIDQDRSTLQGLRASLGAGIAIAVDVNGAYDLA